MDVVVSPVPARPEVFSYLHHAFACEVLRGHPGFADWLAGTFLRVYAHRRFDGCSVPANFDVGDRLMVDAVTGRITTAVVPYYERIPILRTARAERPEPDPQRWAALIGELTGDGHALLVYADKRYVPGSAEYGERSGTHQVMYRRSAEGLTVHCLGARGGYARSATSEREAGQACAAADVSSAHRRPLLLIRADPAATVSFDAGVLRAELGRALAGAPLTVTAGTPARIDIGPTASRTICAHTGQMIVGRLPHDIRPIHVLTEARERLVAALRLLAARMPDTGLEVHLEDAARLSADTASLRFLALRASAGAAAGAGEAFERLTDRVLTAEHALLDRLHATTGDLSDVEELPSLSA